MIKRFRFLALSLAALIAVSATPIAAQNRVSIPNAFTYNAENDQTGTAYAVQDTDVASMVTFSNVSSIAATIPKASTGSGNNQFQAGWWTFLYNKGAGTVTLTPTTSTINAGSTLVLLTGQGGILQSDGTNYNFIASNGLAASRVHTRQVLISGTTYTTPTGVKQIVVRECGGGGGGGGSGTSGGTDGGAGGDTSFNSIVAKGGSGGSHTAGQATAGGTGGTGSASFRLSGAVGGGPVDIFVDATHAADAGGSGGGSGGGVGGGNAGAAGVANMCGGGGGGGLASALFATLGTSSRGSGGGAGEYAEIVINSPAATYTYAIGAGGTAGTAGTSGNAGGISGSALTIVDEYY